MTVKDELSRYLRLAAGHEILITRHGRLTGVLIGLETEEHWFEYRLENHPDFLRQIQATRGAIKVGQGTRLEDPQVEDTAGEQGEESDRVLAGMRTAALAGYPQRSADRVHASCRTAAPVPSVLGHILSGGE